MTAPNSNEKVKRNTEIGVMYYRRVFESVIYRS